MLRGSEDRLNCKKCKTEMGTSTLKEASISSGTRVRRRMSFSSRLSAFQTRAWKIGKTHRRDLSNCHGSGTGDSRSGKYD